MSEPPLEQHIAILGGGIIGLSTAYYLSQIQTTPLQKIHIIDSAPALLLSASGFAGGFLAEDWFSPPSASLGALSFRLHRELAEAHDGGRRWGYAPSTAYSLSINKRGAGKKPKHRRIKERGNDDWLSKGTSRAEAAHPPPTQNQFTAPSNGASQSEMLNPDGSPAWITKQENGTLEPISEDGCAQVEPRELCEFLLSEIQARGVNIHLSSHATSITSSNRKLTGLNLKIQNGSTHLACTTLIITAGAWTSSVFRTLFPKSPLTIPITPLAGYSLVVRSPRLSHSDSTSNSLMNPSPRRSHAIFASSDSARHHSPELFSRYTGAGTSEIYIAGVNDEAMPLPPDVTGVAASADPAKFRELKRTTVLLTGLITRDGDDDVVEDDLEVVRTGLCLRPVSRSGVPVVARLDGEKLGLSDGGKETEGGVFVAAGHGPWGISLSLGTGCVVAEMVMGRELSADIEGLGLR